MVCLRRRPPGERECVVKCCLKKSLLLPEVLQGIERYVCNSSRLVHHGTLLVNHYACDTLRRGERLSTELLADQMLYYGAFATVGGASRTKHSALGEFYRNKQELYPSDLQRLKGDSAILNAAAKQMATNVATYLRTTFAARLRMVVRARLPDGTHKMDINAVVWHVRGMPRYGAHRVLDQRQTALVEELREIVVGANDSLAVIDDPWLERNLGKVLGFYAWILSKAEEIGFRRFNLLPVARQKRHFIAISSEVLRHLLIDANVVEKSLKPSDFVSMIDDHRRSVFRTRASWRLGDTIETDGVAVCFHLRKQKADVEAGPTRPVKRRKRAAAGAPDRAPAGVQPESVVGVDPGRCNIASTVQRLADGSVKRCRLTREQYYRDSHAADNLERLQRMDRRHVAAEMAALSEVVGKTTDLQQFEEYLSAKKEVDPVLWKHRLRRGAAMLSMDTFIHKRKTVDRFWRRTVGLQRGMTVAYGDAGFASSGCGERSVPTCKMKEAAGRFARVVEVDEFLTSKRCCECGGGLLPVYVPGSPRPLRAVRRCGSTACNEAPLKSRDWSAAINIMRRYVEPEAVPWLHRPDVA